MFVSDECVPITDADAIYEPIKEGAKLVMFLHDAMIHPKFARVHVVLSLASLLLWIAQHVCFSTTRSENVGIREALVFDL